ncbi:MAG: thymidine phosphorylase [Chloroflexi bacterium]|nr:thymidine phosphorylase [Chloroflexota bacterium]
MRAVDIIIKKRDRGELTQAEIEYFIRGYARNEIPDYQAAAWTMAVQLNGMSARETTDLTLAIVATGDTLDLSQAVPVAVDKHSTGGVGDKTTLVVEPLVCACGLAVGKMSGRGLGFSGGTLDKMESIPGFRVDLTADEIIKQMRKIGLVLTGQTGNLAPADGKLYALRDVTGTVPSIPLIASSVMSKKIAAGAQAIVLDVKIGVGAFMKNLDEARELGTLMVKIAKLAGRSAVALLSDMNQPLGYAVGNVLELKEAIETLQGGGPKDFKDHCLTTACHMLNLGGVTDTVEAAYPLVENAIADGSAWSHFRELVGAQDGDVAYIDDPSKLPRATFIETISSPQDGYLSELNARIVGETSVTLGAGRATKADKIDHAVGIVVHNKVGEKIKLGQPLYTIHANDLDKLANARDRVMDAHSWSDQPVEPLPLFYGVIR